MNSLAAEMRRHITAPANILPFLNPGRLVKVSEKKRGRQGSLRLSFPPSFLLLRHCASDPSPKQTRCSFSLLPFNDIFSLRCTTFLLFFACFTSLFLLHFSCNDSSPFFSPAVHSPFCSLIDIPFITSRPHLSQRIIRMKSAQCSPFLHCCSPN